MRGVLCIYLFCTLCFSLPFVRGAAFSPLVTRLHTEVGVLRASFEEHGGIPSFGMEQVQLASNMLSNLWKSVDENFEIMEMVPINYPEVLRTQQPAKSMRKVSEDGFDYPDCGIGRMYFTNKTVNTCTTGYLCVIDEVLCNVNGVPVYMPTPTNGSIAGFDWSVCEVTKLQCVIGNRGETVDLREQYGTSGCAPIPEATWCYGSAPQTCFVQLLCDNFLNFGYNSYGLKCESDSFLCGNVVIPDTQSSLFGRYQSDIINGDCQLLKGGCVIPSNNNATCTLFNYTCGFQTDLGINSNNSCSLQRYNVPCAQENSQSSNCAISQITCNGLIYDTNQAIPDQGHCYVSKIVCDGTSAPVNPTNCIPTTMVCNGEVNYFSTYTGALSNCVIDQLTCPAQSNCTTLQFACPQAPKCLATQLPCQVQCMQQLNTSACACPDDRIGERCQNYAPISCAANLFYPTLNCLPSPLPDPNDKLLDGDRKCLVYDDYNANASLGYTLDCQYYQYTPPQNRTFNFTYWASNGEISFSQPVQWMMLQKIFNFNQLSDNAASFLTPYLSIAQILGNEPIWFNFSLENIPDRFWLSRRLYYEIAFQNMTSAPVTTATRGFIDAPTRPISTATMHKINTVALVLALGGVLVFLGLSGYFGYKYYRFYRKQHPVSRSRR